MEASGKSFNFLTDPIIYQVPFFQRAYVWDEDNWRELLDNLSSSHPSFLGSIILKQNGKKMPGEADKFDVIDGQQRLTTITILFQVLSKVIPEEEQDALDITTKKYVYYVDKDTKERFLKLQHSKYDSEYYENVMYGKVDLDKINDDSHNIYRCYKFFFEELNKIASKDIKIATDIYRKLTDEKCVVVITLDPSDREQAIFDTINNAGVTLSSADTIKNSIFQQALELCGKDPTKRKEVINLYEDSWETRFNESEETVNFWDESRRSGRVMRTNLEIFLHAFAVIKGIYDPNKHKLEDLAVCYKEHIKDLSYSDLSAFIKDIAGYANSYFILLKDFDPSKIKFDDVYSKLLLIFEKYDVSTYIPYVLKCKTEDKVEEALKKLSVLEKYLVRNIASGASTHNYNKECHSLIHGGFTLENALQNENVSDVAVRNGMHRLKNKQATLLLFLIELARRNDPKCSEKTLSYNYSLEHIMPQDYESEWGVDLLPVVNEKGEALTNKAEAENYRYSCIYSIGNMTLLSKQLNSSLKNRKFTDKIDGFGKNKGIKDLSSLFITTHDIIEPYNKGDKVWNESKILNRESQLSEEFLKYWPLQ